MDGEFHLVLIRKNSKVSDLIYIIAGVIFIVAYVLGYLEGMAR